PTRKMIGVFLECTMTSRAQAPPSRPPVLNFRRIDIHSWVPERAVPNQISQQQHIRSISKPDQPATAHQINQQTRSASNSTSDQSANQISQQQRIRSISKSDQPATAHQINQQIRSGNS